MGFNKDFAWGVATASYQIEGGAYEDGKGLSVWDEFCKIPDKIADGYTGEVACDHYHSYKQDIRLMKSMGIKAYRFSVSWTRVMPSGTGEINEKGMEFYHNLISELIDNGIEPYVTLFHWDYPYALHNQGGWLNPESSNWFAEYAKVITERFSDRVKYFITFNEPQCFIGLGYHHALHAPGVKMSLKDGLQMAHNVLLAHGKAVKMIRQHAKVQVKIGYAPTCSMTYPVTESDENIEAARKALFSMPKSGEDWSWNVTWWSDPVFFGKYPEDGIKLFQGNMPFIAEGDMDIIAQPLDFYGQNIYNGAPIVATPSGGFERLKRAAGHAKAANGWPITPQTLYWGPKFLYERYKLPIYITENGMVESDVIALDGYVHDPNRIDFLHRYLKELKRASDEGIVIKGYFLWSFMDNFEWAHGFNARFGLVYVDYSTQKRIVKDSGYWYRDTILQNGKNI